ncbi:MAG: hydroxymethylglutaryl-CoA synthase family protein [Spirochaetales bacterium]|nr:hydroxymethylglutaryl-CoA synthase family protein [Spirochaetales bacterium]
MNRVGIEKLHLYLSTLCLDMRDLAAARDKDPDKVVSDYLIDRRTLLPPWEDTVTFGANAAVPIIAEEDRDAIGLLVVGTESSVDFGKPISTNIHRALKLGPNVRNFETKHACYSGVAALDTAVNYVASGHNRGKKALVISTDFSRMHLGLKEEFVMGGVSAAVLVSDQPKLVEFETMKKGTWTLDTYDTFRPSAKHEVGNNEVSLYSYLDALEGAYRDYLESAGGKVDFDAYFRFLVYHTPFAGMAFQAHRTLTNLFSPKPRPELKADFDRRVRPALKYSRQAGSTYGSSNFAGIMSILTGDTPPADGDRIGFYAYGSGAVGEFYSGRILGGAVELAKAGKLDAEIARRRVLPVAEYEKLEQLRESYIENPDFTPDRAAHNGLYDEHYRGRGRLVLAGVKDFYRTYEWS